MPWLKLHWVFIVQLVLFLTLLWGMFWPFTISTIHDFKITNPNKLVCRGGLLSYDLTITKHYDIPGVIILTIFDGWGYTFPEKKTALAPGTSVLHRALEIPLRSPTGKFKFSRTVVYTYMLRQFVVRAPLLDFEIVDCTPTGTPIESTTLLQPKFR